MWAMQKLQNNVLTSSAVAVLGGAKYARFVAEVAVHLPAVIRDGSLRPVDAAMGSNTERFHYRGTEFLFDCRYCDEQIREGDFSFGLAREIYIRDCYFKYQPAAVYADSRIVMDLGANRGAFSVLMAARADFVLSVEAQRQFIPIIEHNMRKNGFSNYAVEEAFVGAGGLLGEGGLRTVSIGELLRRHRIERIDFMKIDIEGSEFVLFGSPDWLGCVRALSMEVHPEFGDPELIIDKLQGRGFLVEAADENLDRLSDVAKANFIYAWRKG